MMNEVLQVYSPLLFDFIKTLMKQFSFKNALQRMTAQQMHCDPYAKLAPADELHILLTVDGTDHCLGLSSSHKIQSLDTRYRLWHNGSGGICSAAVRLKLQENKLDDALLLPRAGDRPLQAVEQALLAGLDRDFDAQTNQEGVTLKRIVCVHGGVPGSRKSNSKSLDAFWTSGRNLEQIRMSRERKFEHEGVEVSTTLLANFRGTPEAAAQALEHAAQHVLDVHTSRLGSLIKSKNKPVKVDFRDHKTFKQILQKGNIGTLQDANQDYWSDERRQAHRLRSEKGGSSKVGPMTGKTMQDHGALTSKGAKDRHELLLMVANGLEGDTEKWTCEASRNGTAVHYLFRTTKTGQEPIHGVREFEQFVLDDANGFVQDARSRRGTPNFDGQKKEGAKRRKKAQKTKKQHRRLLSSSYREEHSCHGAHRSIPTSPDCRAPLLVLAETSPSCEGFRV
jgi:hypothetical protein